MNLLLSLFTSLLFFSTPVVSAQTPSPLTFPIASLGNCSDKTTCKAYCEIEANHTVCSSFALSHGLAKPDPIATQSATIAQKAASFLGCTSIDSCKTLCSQEANFAKCSEFAKNNNLPGGQKKLPDAAELLPVAKALGLTATTVTELKSACSDTANRELCTRLAVKVGIQGGLKQVPPSLRPLPSGKPPLLEERKTTPGFTGGATFSGTNTKERPPEIKRAPGMTEKNTLEHPTLSTEARPPVATEPKIQEIKKLEPTLMQVNTGAVKGIETEASFSERILSSLRSFFKL